MAYIYFTGPHAFAYMLAVLTFVLILTTMLISGETFLTLVTLFIVLSSTMATAGMDLAMTCGGLMLSVMLSSGPSYTTVRVGTTVSAATALLLVALGFFVNANPEYVVYVFPVTATVISVAVIAEIFFAKRWFAASLFDSMVSNLGGLRQYTTSEFSVSDALLVINIACFLLIISTETMSNAVNVLNFVMLLIVTVTVNVRGN